MRGFCHGWRRKTGLVTLVLACLCMCGWMRSTWVVDELLCVTDRDKLHAIYTCRVGIGWSKLHKTVSASDFVPPFGFRSLQSGSFTLTSNSMVRPFNWNRDGTHNWGSQFLGFRSGTWECRTTPPAPLEVSEIRVWIAPYWIFVWPLALTSLWLIFRVPPKSSLEKCDTCDSE